MPFGTRAERLRPAPGARFAPPRGAFVRAIGGIEPHSHVRWAAIRPQLQRLARRGPVGRLLEIGAGGGELTLGVAALLRPAAFSSFDYEATPTLARAVAACFRASATHLPIASRSQDAVAMCDVLEHIPDDGRALGEIARVLRPGGWLLLSVPTPEYPKWFGRAFHASVGHVRDGYTLGALRGLLQRHRLRVIAARHHTGLPFLAFARLYYGWLRFHRVASALARCLVFPLSLVDRFVPSPRWGALVAVAVRAAD
jgi:SAM-dependent methyltransferase